MDDHTLRELETTVKRLDREVLAVRTEFEKGFDMALDSSKTILTEGKVLGERISAITTQLEKLREDMKEVENVLHGRDGVVPEMAVLKTRVETNLKTIDQLSQQLRNMLALGSDVDRLKSIHEQDRQAKQSWFIEKKKQLLASLVGLILFLLGMFGGEIKTFFVALFGGG